MSSNANAASIREAVGIFFNADSLKGAIDDLLAMDILTRHPASTSTCTTFPSSTTIQTLPHHSIPDRFTPPHPSGAKP